MTSWNEYRFGELVEFPPKISLKKGEEYPFIDMDAINPSSRYVENNQYKKYDSSGSAKFLDRDVLLARITPCLENGKIAQVKLKNDEVGFGSTEFFVFRSKQNLLNQSFLYYLVKSDLIWKNAVNSMVGASGRQRADASFLKRVKLVIPPLGEQQKIAAILSAYDDLIENNKRRIVLLEKMAEEIYREWFVRFRFPGYQTAEFEKGIPKNWGIKVMRDLVSYYIGGGWGEENESSTFSKGAYVIRGTDIPHFSSGNYTNRVFRYHKPSNFKARKLEVNDFIFEVSGGSKDQLLGRNLMVSEGLLKLFENKVICASFCKQIRFDAQQVSPLFMKYYLKLYYECDLVGIYQVQSTGISNYQFESFLNYQTISLPEKQVLDEFDKLITPIIRQQETLAFENLNLIKTKDSLLPRLISGKLSVEHLDIQFPPSMQEDKAA